MNISDSNTKDDYIQEWQRKHFSDNNQKGYLIVPNSQKENSMFYISIKNFNNKKEFIKNEKKVLLISIILSIILGVYLKRKKLFKLNRLFIKIPVEIAVIVLGGSILVLLMIFTATYGDYNFSIVKFAYHELYYGIAPLVILPMIIFYIINFGILIKELIKDF